MKRVLFVLAFAFSGAVFASVDSVDSVDILAISSMTTAAKPTQPSSPARPLTPCLKPGTSFVSGCSR